MLSSDQPSENKTGLSPDPRENSPASTSPYIRLLESVFPSIADFVGVFDRNGCFVYANQPLLDLWQKSLPEVIGKNLSDLGYPLALATRLHEQVQTVFETGQAVRDETEYTSVSGVGHHDYSFTPVFGKGGTVEAVAGSSRDITHRQQEKLKKEVLLKTLDRERARLSDLLRQAPAFIAVLRGIDHRFEMVNDQYKQVVGDKDLIGQSVRDAFPEVEGQGYFELLDEVYRSREPFTGQNMRFLVQRENEKPLEELYLDIVYQPLIEADNSVSGIFVHGVDVTERKRAEEALEKNTQALALAIEGAQLGTFYCEFPLDKIIWNDLCKDHFFLPHDAEVDFDLFYSLLHPDDRERTRLAIQKALEKREQYNIEYRAVSPDGRTRWINAIGKGYYDESGEPYRFDGITIDITEKKVHERALALLVEINDATREMQNAEATMEMVVIKLGEFLGVSCCAYASVAEDGDHFTVLRDYTNGCLSSTGDYELKAFGSSAVCDLKAGKTLIIRDREKEATPEDNLSALASLQIKAIICMPLVKDGKLVAMMAVYQTEPRHWTSEEISLVEMVAERSWAIIERVRTDQKLYERAREVEMLNARLIRMIREAQHRVKNNLQTTFALIEKQTAKYQKANSVPMEEFVRLKSLVKHLADVHDLLAQSTQEVEEEQRLSSKGALEKLLPMLQQTASKQTIHYSVAEASLTSRQSIALSVILNELVSNALAFGNYKVEVRFTVDGEEASLSISDDGPGFTEDFDAGKVIKTGIELVESLTKFDLRGTSRYHNMENGGAKVTVTFTLPPVLP